MNAIFPSLPINCDLFVLFVTLFNLVEYCNRLKLDNISVKVPPLWAFQADGEPTGELASSRRK